MTILESFVDRIGQDKPKVNGNGKMSMLEQFRNRITEPKRPEIEFDPSLGGMTSTLEPMKPFGPTRLEQAKDIGRGLKEAFFPKGALGPELIKKALGREAQLPTRILPTKEELPQFVERAFTPLTAPLTIPLNVIQGLLTRNPERFKSVLRIATLNPAPGDTVFVGDVLKSVGITDKSIDNLLAKIGEPPIAQEMGLTEKVGLIADFISFSKIEKVIRAAVKAKQPKVFFEKAVNQEIKKVKVIKPKLKPEPITKKGLTIKPSEFAPFSERFNITPGKSALSQVRAKDISKTSVFHGTEGSQAFDILAANKISVKVSTLDRAGQEAVSLSRNKNVSATFGDVVFEIKNSKVALQKAPKGVVKGDVFKGFEVRVARDIPLRDVEVVHIITPESLQTQIKKIVTIDRFGNTEARTIGTVKDLVDKFLGKGMKVVVHKEVSKVVPTIKEAFKSEAGFARIARGKEKIVPIRGSKAKDVQRKIVAQEFRGDKVNLPTEQLEQINARLDVLGLKRRQVVSLGEMERVALDVGVTPEVLLNDTAKRIINRNQVIQLRNLQNTLAQRLGVLEKSKQLPENALRAKVIDKEISQVTNQLDRALTNFVAGNNEIGRAAVANRILARQTLDLGVWLSKAKKLMGKALDEEKLNAITKDIKEMIDEKDINALANYVAGLRIPGNLEKLTVLWKTGLLSSPTTHIANIQGNITMAALETAKDIPATALDVLISLGSRAFGGKGLRTTTITPGTVLAKIKGTKRGFQQAGQFLKTGTYSTDILTKYDLPRIVNFKNKYLQGYTQSIFRSLGAEDIFFREVAMMESFAKQARVIAMNEVRTGKITKSLRNRRIRELLIEPTNDMIAVAINNAERATFQNPNVIADMIASGRRAVRGQGLAGEIAIAGTEVIAPFVRTPTNIASRIAGFSPLGFVKAITKFARPTTRSQEALVNELGRAITGTGVIALGAYLAKKGLLTGNPPTSKSERDQFFAEKQPNSFLAGNFWWQLSRVSPFGNLLLLGAEYWRQSQDKEGLNLLFGVVFGGIKALTEQTFLKGLSGALKAVNDPERSAARFIYQSVGSLVPSIIGRTARTVDPVSRKPENVYQAIQVRIPFFSTSVAPRRDILGNKVLVGGGKLNLIDPFNRKKGLKHPVLVEARNVGVPIGLPRNTISGTKLTGREFSLYQKVQGTILEITLSELISDARYQNLSSVEKTREFEKAIRSVRSYINNTMFPALMIRRYKLPEETNPKVLRNTLAQLNTNKIFKSMDTEKQRRIILRFLK